MPIDASIYNDIQGPQPLAQREAQAMVYERAKDERQQMRQKRVDEAAMRRAVQEAQGDPDKAVESLMRGGFAGAASSLQETIDKSRTAAASRRKVQLDADEAQLKQLTQSVALVTPDNYGQWVQMVRQTDPRLGAMLSDQYDTQTMQRFGGLMLTAKDKMDAERFALDRDARAKEGAADRESREFVATSGQTAADARNAASIASREKVAAMGGAGGAAGFTLSPGQQRFDAEGKPIAQVAPRPTGTGTGGGRNVTSGDARRIGEVNTAINETAALRSAISGNGSGDSMAGLKTWIPDMVTNWTGWGTDAKQKQAVIALVKQIIGKGLEGGVLRKEDETKYAKILPTISDPPALVKAKLDGLDRALADKRDEGLSALEDAGYNTTAFRARADGAPQKNTAGGNRKYKVEVVP